MGVSGRWRWTLSRREGRGGAVTMLWDPGLCLLERALVTQSDVCRWWRAPSTAAVSLPTAAFAQMARVTKNREHTRGAPVGDGAGTLLSHPRVAPCGPSGDRKVGRAVRVVGKSQWNCWKGLVVRRESSDRWTPETQEDAVSRHARGADRRLSESGEGLPCCSFFFLSSRIVARF